MRPVNLLILLAVYTLSFNSHASNIKTCSDLLMIRAAEEGHAAGFTQEDFIERARQQPPILNEVLLEALSELRESYAEATSLYREAWEASGRFFNAVGAGISPLRTQELFSEAKRYGMTYIDFKRRHLPAAMIVAIAINQRALDDDLRPVTRKKIHPFRDQKGEIHIGRVLGVSQPGSLGTDLTLVVDLVPLDTVSLFEVAPEDLYRLFGFQVAANGTQSN